MESSKLNNYLAETQCACYLTMVYLNMINDFFLMFLSTLIDELILKECFNFQGWCIQI
jgi:hypothetical protein